MFRMKMLFNKLFAILGDALFKKVTFLNGKEVPIFIFQGYVPKEPGSPSRIEDQVCKENTEEFWGHHT